ncbi:RING finger protein 10-like [Homarus americanus]|uniref:RING finger protein 10-like n=1 Tax=Homarus americanus TaxID=6706 RepID=A0A8J5TK00_HOMAM|nr:RING finger protein 10-like [Homarus americanus]
MTNMISLSSSSSPSCDETESTPSCVPVWLCWCMDTTTPSTATTAAMDKNNKVPRLPQLTVKTTSQEAVGREYGGKKSAPQHARKREYDRPDSGRKPVAGRGGRTGQRYVRPREKMGGKVDGGTGTSESGSLYCTGGKKQNITHLMNWWGPGHRSHGNRRGGGAQVKRYSSHAPKYSKEHYLQANCQFVVDDQEDYSLYSANQDLLVEWRFVEEVRLHVSEAPACPICLHPPVAAKEFGIGEEIELQLMRRERDSLVPVPAVLYNEEIMNTATRISHPTAATPYAKLLLASKDEVRSHILMREKRDLEAQLVEEGDQPEACFIDEALSLLRTRQDSLSSDSDVGELLIKAEEGLEAMSLSSPEEPSSGDSVSSVEEPLSLAPRNAPKSTFYFYQASNGAHIYMHAVNVQMLVQEYGALENCPPIIVAKVVEKESVSMTEDLRLRLRYLRHLPVTCCFDVVEVSFRHPVVSKMTTAMFQEQIQYRQWKRNERAREEWKIEMRVRAEEDRMMGRSKAATNLKIESLRHFPSFGEDFPAGPSGEVNEGANTAGGGEVIGSEASTSPSSDVVTSSSVEGTTTGMSFAKMIREGQTRVQHSSSEPVNITRGTRSRRRVPQLSESSTNDGNCTEEEERNLAVPEFKHAFSDAVAKALDAAAKKSAAKAEENEDIGRRGKKKKKHKVLLFSSGGLN